MLVELGDEFPDFELAFGRFVGAEAIQPTAGQVSVCMASEGIAGKQETIDEHDHGDQVEVK